MLEFANERWVGYVTIMAGAKQILLEKNHAGLQFLKYALCGGVAFLADLAVFYLMAVFVFPALTENDFFVQWLQLEVEPLATAARLRNFWLGKTASFIVANLVAYVLNVLFVFKGGKHPRHHEVALFFAVSLVAFLLGTWTGDALIRFFGVQTTLSNLSAVFFAVLINYAGRKFFIFRG